MPITTNETTLGEETVLTATISNGDLAALKEIQNKWKFKDISGVLKFMIAVMKRTETKTVGVKIGGEMKEILPVNELLEEEPNTPAS
jgi:hypothetical protein